MSSHNPSVDTILGAVVMAGILGALFLGGACIQTYTYYRTSRADDMAIKGAVGALMAANILQFAVYTYTIWYYIVDAFDSAWAPQMMNWSFKLPTWLSVALVLLLDIFYTIYLIKLAPTLVVPGLVGLTVAAGNIVAVVLGVKIIIFTQFTNIYAISSSALIYLFFTLFCLKTTSIAAAMTYYLNRYNVGFTKGVCFSESHSPTRRILKLVVGSPVVVAAASFAVLICHLLMPRSISCVVVYMAVSKLYHNCFLSLLACRAVPYPADGHGHEGYHNTDTPMRSNSERRNTNATAVTVDSDEADGDVSLKRESV